MLTSPGAVPVQASWSEANREFLDFTERNPEYRSRSAFAPLYGQSWLRKLSLQPWPLFVGPERWREMERAALGVDGLLKGAVERFLAGDRARIMDFYRVDHLPEAGAGDFLALDMSEEFLEILLEEPTGIRGAISRGDYIETADGLKCIEFNGGAFVGGMSTQAVGELSLATEPVRRFLRETGRAARAPGTYRAFFRHLIEDTARLGAWRGGDFNVAVLAYPHEPDQAALQNAELYNRELRRVLEEDGTAPGGRVFLCSARDFTDEGGVLRVEGHPVHAVFEQHDGTADFRMVLWFFKQRRVNLFSGPISALLVDKRNLALVSENAGSDEFTSEERGVIERHVPWTRRVLPGRTEFRGRPVRLPEDLVELREEMVLKKGTSLGGSYVHVGRFRTPDEWRAVIAQALRENDWVAQEYLASPSYTFQHGEAGVAPHELVWGLFACGRHFGGPLLRMQPRGVGGVVNTKQGAEVAPVLELVEPAADGPPLT